MISTITISTDSTPVTLHSVTPGSKVVASRAEGLQGTPPIRNLITPRGQVSGAFIRSRYSDERTIQLELEIIDSTIEAAFDQFDTIAAALNGAIATDRTLKWTRDAAGQQLQSTVRLSEMQPLTLTDGAPWIKVLVVFKAGDPRVYDQVQTTGTGAALAAPAGGKTYTYSYTRGYNPSSGGTVSFNNTGSVPTPPVLRFYGFCTSPQAVLTDDQRIVLDGTIAAGDYLEVDCAARTVKLNGTTSRLNLLNPTSTTFFDLPVGSGQLQMLASNFEPSARLDVIYRPAFI